MSTECICGKDGHPINSTACPIHGVDAMAMRLRPPLFVSFTGNMKGKTAVGWVVIDWEWPITDGSHVGDLVRRIEEVRSYDTGTLVIVNFQRLEI